MSLRWWAFATVAVVSGSAHAATPCVGSVHTCVNAETFWPHAGASLFFGIGSTTVAAPGQVGFGLVTTYQHNPLVVHTPSPGPLGGESPVVANQANANFLFNFGVARNLELFAALPVTIAQSGEGLRSITAGDGLRSTAMGDPRFGFAWTWKGLTAEPPPQAQNPWANRAMDPPPPPLSVASVNWGGALRFTTSIPSGERSQFVTDRTATFSLVLSLEFRRKRWFAATEAGVRIRPTTNFLDSQVGSQAVAALGLGYDVVSAERLSVLAEARALPSLIGGASSCEWTAGLRSAPLSHGRFSVMAGAGTAIPLGDRGFPNPDLRLLVSLRYAPDPTEEKR